MKIRLKHFLLICALLLSLSASAQTPLTFNKQSFLMPGDSIWAEISLSGGDFLKWNLRLVECSEESGETVFTLVSDVDGELQKKSYSRNVVDTADSLKITKQARYRLMLKSTGTKGRLTDFTVWSKLGKENRVPFPMPTVQRLAEKFSPGDKYTVEYEFLLPDTTKFATLLALDLPKDLVKVWTITSMGDSLTAIASVSRWIGETGTLSFSDKGQPKGGRLTLKLEVDIADQGDATVYVGPGSTPPPWLPKSARTVITHRHDPWSAVVVPPLTTYKGWQSARAPETLKSPYIAQSLRIRGVAPEIASKIQQIYVSRDSLAAQRRARLKTVSNYDSVFLIGDKAYLPPDLHTIFSTPLSDKPIESYAAGPVEISWFVDSKSKNPIDAKLFEWRYDAARIAYDAAPDEFFWDSTEIALRPQMKIYLANKTAPDKPQKFSFEPVAKRRPATFQKNNELFRDYSRRMLCMFLENSSKDTLCLVFHQARVIERPLGKDISKLPGFAKTALVVMGILAIAGVFALFEIRRRERNRKKLAAELDAELSKAREVQLRLLPKGNVEIKGLEVLGLHQSMQSVGGDYYDFFQLEDGTVILCVADVAGHGLPAALLMSNLQATLRAVASAGKESNEIISLLNREMFTRTSPDRFVTMFLCEISPDRKRITACNAGHNPTYIIRRNGDIEELDGGGIMLGVMDIWPFIQMDYELREGDMIVLYTDGIPEATIGDQDMFGYDRLKYFLQENRKAPLQDVATKLFKKVVPENNTYIEDDMCVVLVRVK